MDNILPSKEIKKDIQILSDQIIRDIEEGVKSLENIAFRCVRLSKLTGDQQMEQILGYEIKGYPKNREDKISNDIIKLARIAGRRSSLESEIFYTQTLSNIESNKKRLEETNVALNWREQRELDILTRLFSERKLFLYQSTSYINAITKYSNTIDDIFFRIKEKVNGSIKILLNNSKDRFIAIYENLNSENPENWRLAIQSCRMLIKDLADQIYHPRDPLNIGGKNLIILDEDHYINRICAFIRENADSNSFKKIFNTNIDLLESLLKKTFDATNKGSHEDVYDREEADRIVLQTYIIIGDILKIYMEKEDEKIK